MAYDPYGQQQPQYPPMPREAVTTRGDMSQPEKVAWALAVMCTFGLALPFYLARRRSLRRVTVTRYR